jgi:hypothetical protein
MKGARLRWRHTKPLSYGLLRLPDRTPVGQPGTHRIVGLTIFNPRYLLERDGRLTVTFPEIVETRSAEEMAAVLVAA